MVWNDVGKRIEASVTAQPVRGARIVSPTTLELLGDEYKPSKRHHDYLRWYDLHFAPLRQSARKVVEVGVETDRSIKMWEEYFPNADIIGLDIAPHCKKFEGGASLYFHRGSIRPEVSCFSHFGDGWRIRCCHRRWAPHTPINDADLCWIVTCAEAWGLYVIEDIIKQPQTVEFFCGLARGVNHWPDGFPTRDWAKIPTFSDQDWLTNNVVGVALYRYIAISRSSRVAAIQRTIRFYDT